MRTQLLVFLLALSVAGCGFQLRGNATLPFESVFVEGGQEIVVALERAIRPTATKVTGRAQDAQVTLQILGEEREKRILSLDNAGRVSEYRLLYRVNFKVFDVKGRELLEQQHIELKRDITFNDNQTLAKESEELLLYRDMQVDAVQQIIRRLGVIHLSQ